MLKSILTSTVVVITIAGTSFSATGAAQAKNGRNAAFVVGAVLGVIGGLAAADAAVNDPPRRHKRIIVDERDDGDDFQPRFKQRRNAGFIQEADYVQPRVKSWKASPRCGLKTVRVDFEDGSWSTSKQRVCR